MSNETSKSTSRWWIVPTGLVLAGIMITVLVAGYAWQNDEASSRLDESALHANTALKLQDAAVEGDLAAELLGAYVSTGEEALIPQIQSHASEGLSLLTDAISQSGSGELQQVVVEGNGLAEGAGAVIALRQAGNVQAAAASLEELSIEFESFATVVDAAIDSELAEAASLEQRSDDAERTAAWLLITAMAVGIATAGGVLFALITARRRRVSETPTPA